MRLFLSLVTAVLVAVPARAESLDVRFFEGLRERHLYRLAELYANEQGDRDDLAEGDRADLAIETALVFTDHALASPPDVRGPLWANAEAICDQFAQRLPDSPHRAPVDVQRALVSLAHGKQLRKEAAGARDEAVQWTAARDQLRSATRRLGQIAGDVNEQLVSRRLRPTSGPSPPAFSVGQLQALEANVAFHVAEAQYELGLCYAPQSADRDDSLLQALGRLEPLVDSSSVEGLEWRARVVALACLRELGRLETARGRLETWSRAGVPPAYAARLAAERVRLLLAAGKADDALDAANRAMQTVAKVDGDLALAHLEALLATSRPTRQADSATALTEAALEVGRRHGPYWARQAQLLVGRTLAMAGSSDDVETLLLAAESLYRNRQTDEAAAAYDRAVELLDAAQQTDRAVDVAMTAAAIMRQSDRQAEAARRYRQVAMRAPDHPRAAEAHRWAILSTADELRGGGSIGDASAAQAYEQLLREHIERWPNSPTADDARLWLAQLLAHRNEWPAAIGLLREIDRQSEAFAAAVPLVAICYGHTLDELDDGGSQRRTAELVAEATGFLQPIITGPDNRWPATWSALQRTASLALARLHLQSDDGASSYAEKLLSAALRGVDPSARDEATVAWQNEARALLVVALAQNGRLGEARQVLDQLAAGEPQALLDVLEQVTDLLRSAGVQRQELGQLALEVVRLLDARKRELSPEARAAIVRYRAFALSAAGERDQALGEFARLAEEFPTDGPIQEGYARLLAEGQTAPDLERALRQWQGVERHSRAGGPRWRRARRARMELLERLGETDEGEKLLRLTRLLYPNWDADQNAAR